MEQAQRSQLINQFYSQKYGEKQSLGQQSETELPTQVNDKSQLLLLTVQIDENRTGIINVFEGDDPEDLAQFFCSQYQVNPRIVPLLAQNIGQNIEQAMRERQNMRNYLSQKEQVPKQDPVELPSKVVNSFSSQKYSMQQADNKSSPWSKDLTFSPKINKNSRKMAKNRSFDIGSKTVYDRLFQDAQNKKIRQQIMESQKDDEEEPSNHNVKSKSRVHDPSGINYGQILYQRGLKQKEEKLQKVESVKREQQSQMLQECSHQPQINEISRAIAKRPNEPIGDHLNKIAKVIKERKDQAKNQRVIDEEQSCSFQPQLNKISEYIIEEKKKLNNNSESSLPHYHSLYMDHKVRQQKIQNLDQQLFRDVYTFHPKVDEISEKIVHGTSFNERLQRYQVEKIGSKERSLIREQEIQESQLFRPKTGRPPENRSGDTFKQLYQHSIIQAQHKAQKIQSLAEQQAVQSQQHLNPQSQKINDQATLASLNQIFRMLDNDNDGIIDAQRIDVTKFERSALEVLGPLLLEMEEGGHQLTKEEFLDSALRLLSTITVQEKHDLLHRFRKKNSDANPYNFHPMINDRSQKLAANKRPYGTPQVYEMFIDEKRQFDQRIQQLKQMKDEQELNQQLGRDPMSRISRLSRSSQKYN